MARYEVTARTAVHGLPAHMLSVEPSFLARMLRPEARLRSVAEIGPGEYAVVLQPRRGPHRKPDDGWTFARRNLLHIGIHPGMIRQIDVHRVSRRGDRRVLVRSWVTPGGSDGPGSAGVREPRNPRPTPPSLRAARDLPD